MKRTCAVALLCLGLATPVAANPACGATIFGTWELTSDMNCAASLTHGVSVLSFSTLNCNGFKIIGPDLGAPNGTVTGRYGIRIDEAEHVTINGCDVKGYEVGVRVTDSVAITLNGTIARKNPRYGFEIKGNTSQVLSNGIQAISNGDEGVHYGGPFPGENVMQNAFIYRNWREGLYLFRANQVWVRDSTITENSQDPGGSHPDVNLDETTDAWVQNVSITTLARTIAQPQASMSLCVSSIPGGCQ